MTNRAVIVVAACCLMVSCASEPEWFPPPIQRPIPASVSLPPEFGAFHRMNDPDAGDWIVRGIQDKPEGTGWRWTHERPVIRYRLQRTTGWRFVVDFGIIESTLKQTGPVTLSFWIDGHLLDRVRYSRHGDYRFEKPVPAAWLKTGEDILFAADVGPPYVADADGVKLGIILHSAGFVAE